MKPKIIAAFVPIAAGKLTAVQLEEMADAAIKIMEDYNKTAALVALESVKRSVLEGDAKVSSIEEPKAVLAAMDKK